jgi:hypothetical protein
MARLLLTYTTVPIVPATPHTTPAKNSLPTGLGRMCVAYRRSVDRVHMNKSFSHLMASAVFILDLKGKVILSRNYRGDIPMSAVEQFMPLLTELEEDEQTITPVLTHQGIHYLYLRHNNLYRMIPPSTLT